MKKLRSRPPRFVALDNRAVDDVRLSVLDLGLLAAALRCLDCADFTVPLTQETPGWIPQPGAT